MISPLEKLLFNSTMQNSLLTLIRDGFILVFNSEELDLTKTADALQNAGINNMEVTCRISNSLQKLKDLKQAKPEFIAGAASLIDAPNMVELYNKQHSDSPIPTIDEVVQAGADYLVSAINFREETFNKYSKNLPMCPGCATASEIVFQYNLGAHFCKLFPASVVGGKSLISGIDPAIHNTISIMPTGGTNMSNIPDYIKAKVLILGGSFSMIDKETLKQIKTEQNYELLSSEFKKIKSLIDDERAKQYPNLDFKTASIEEIQKQTGRLFNLRS